MTAQPRPSEPGRGLRLGPVTVVRGRVLAATTGLLGVALAVPLVFWPTHTISVASLGDAADTPDFRQSFWSWGRYVDTTIAGEPQFDYANVVSLGLFVLTLLVGLAAGLVFALWPAAEAAVIAAAGLAWAGLAVTSALAARLGDAVGGLYGTNEGILVTVEPAGWFQTVAAALLLVALGLVIARPTAAVAKATWAAVPRGPLASRGRADDPAGPGGVATATTPRVGFATLRDAPVRDPGVPDGSVGFTDGDPDDDRFGPR